MDRRTGRGPTLLVVHTLLLFLRDSSNVGVIATDVEHHSTALRNVTQWSCTHGDVQFSVGEDIRISCNSCTCGVQEKRATWKCTRRKCVVRRHLIERINSAALGWQATGYVQLSSMSLDDVVRWKLGTRRPAITAAITSSSSSSSSRASRLVWLRSTDDDQVDAAFDARRRWPRRLRLPADQQQCAASWIYSAAGVAANRLAVKTCDSSNSDVSKVSPRDVTDHVMASVGRESADAQLCSSEPVDTAWSLLATLGFQCNYERCEAEGNATSTAGARNSNTTSSAESNSTSLCHVSSLYRLAPIEREIMRDIQLYGPVQAVMEVKEDFYLYRSGVYSYSLPADYTPSFERDQHYHAVSILGWGIDNTSQKERKFWLCANSWGEWWGEGGYFRISRGTDECSIESHVIGVTLDVIDDVTTAH